MKGELGISGSHVHYSIPRACIEVVGDSGDTVLYLQHSAAIELYAQIGDALAAFRGERVISINHCPLTRRTCVEGGFAAKKADREALGMEEGK